MSPFRPGLELAAGIFTIGSLGLYAILILCKKTDPMIATWLIWAFVDTAMAVGMSREDSLNHQIRFTAAGGCFIAFLSLFYGKIGWNIYDQTCLVLGVLSGGLLFLLPGGVISIVLSCAANFIGAIPTIKSVQDKSENEHMWPWILSLVASVLQTVAIAEPTIDRALQPLTFLSITLSVLIAKYRSSQLALALGKPA